MKRLRFFFSYRSPFWPSIFSAVIAPGMGQLLNGEFKKGLAMVALFLGAGYLFSTSVTERLSLILPGTPETWVPTSDVFRDAVMKLFHETPGFFITFHVLIILLWGYSVWDAYATAKNRLHFRA
jgi:hypothetical protein